MYSVVEDALILTLILPISDLNSIGLYLINVERQGINIDLSTVSETLTRRVRYVQALMNEYSMDVSRKSKSSHIT